MRSSPFITIVVELKVVRREQLLRFYLTMSADIASRRQAFKERYARFFTLDPSLPSVRFSSLNVLPLCSTENPSGVLHSSLIAAKFNEDVVYRHLRQKAKPTARWLVPKSAIRIKHSYSYFLNGIRIEILEAP